MASKSFLDQESLFSLEVVVDTLALDSVVCRFPAVAFRLLDFPTLLIYHVEPELGNQIKTKINADPLYNVPKQLPELQDRHGNFSVKKGKSCLFKVSPNTVQTHLQSSPLYVMIIDTYPEVPKLIASCTVPLDTCIDEIYDDVCRLGISVPSAHGERGEYQLSNLMGRNIGNISLGVRLLSLGVGLLSHLPESSVAKLKPKAVIKTSNEQEKSEHQQADVVLYDLEALGRSQPYHISITPETKEVDDFQGQTDIDDVQNVATQTVQAKRKNVRHVKTQQLNISPEIQNTIDDFFVTNVACPPPLFFNSEQEVKTSDSLLFSHYPLGLPTAKTIPEGDYSDGESIRDEDKFSDSDTEFDSSKLFRPAPKEFIQKTVIPQKKPSAPQLPGGLTNLPILNALIQEISALQGGQRQPADPETQRLLHKPVPGSPKGKKSNSGTPRSPSSRKHFELPKETKEEFAARISSPRRVPPGHPEPRPSSPDIIHKHTCQAGQHEVQKDKPATVNKGWIRHQPAVGVQKTKLQYGMTNTQRLRLAKGNPELLKSLEKEEQVRLQKKRQQMLKKWGSTHLFSANNTADISTEISRHPHGDTGRNRGRPDIPSLNLYGAEPKHHKKPVPTPRLSVSTKELHEQMEAELAAWEMAPVITPRPRSTKSRQPVNKDLGVQLIPEKQGKPDHDHEASSQSEPPSSRIEVHVPTASMHDDDNASDVTSVHDSEMGDLGKPKINLSKTKTLYSPGFPAHDSVEYSDDFDVLTLSNRGRPQLDNVNDRDLTRDSENYTETLEGLSAGDELGLRCVVEKYSDDNDSNYSESSSYHSAPSQVSQISDRDTKKLRIPVPSPNTSALSPNTFNNSHKPSLPTRQPFTAVSVNDGINGTPESTAYINHSQVPSQVSQESQVSQVRNKHKQPRPSPRTPRSVSVRTESISSYAPSDTENSSPLSPLTPRTPRTPGRADPAEYSDSFEDYSEADEDYTDSEYVPTVPKAVKEMQVDPRAKLGYTWGY